MKLDASYLRFLGRDEFRILTAIEQGMKNHDLVPTQLIASIAKMKAGEAKKALTVVHKYKLVWHSCQSYDGYRLTYSGYDYLALRALSNRGTIVGVGQQLGVGKESDVFMGFDQDNKPMALKLHRLGRISFRAIKAKRDYLEHRKSASWIYLSRLAALKEYAFMKALYDHKFPVPKPIDWSRHCVLMSLVDGYPLTQVKELRNPGKVYSDLMNLLLRLASYGLIHCDFNEFNLLINDNEEITLIDFPQMVSTSHKNAEMYFNRDVQCIRAFFSKKMNYETETYPIFTVDASEKKYSLDIAVAASGFTNQDQMEFEELSAQLEKAKTDTEELDSESESDDDEDSTTTEKSDSPDTSEPVQQLLTTVIANTDEKQADDKEEEEETDSNTEESTPKTEKASKPVIDQEYIRKKVRSSATKKNKPHHKANNSKVKIKQEVRDIIKHW